MGWECGVSCIFLFDVLSVFKAAAVVFAMMFIKDHAVSRGGREADAST